MISQAQVTDEIQDQKNMTQIGMNSSMYASTYAGANNSTYAGNSTYHPDDDEYQDEEAQLLEELQLKKQIQDAVKLKSEQVFDNLKLLVLRSK